VIAPLEPFLFSVQEPAVKHGMQTGGVEDDH